MLGPRSQARYGGIVWCASSKVETNNDRLLYSLPKNHPMQEYKRLETLRQIKEADRRTEEMTARKEEMVNQRRKAALEVNQRPQSRLYIFQSSTQDKLSNTQSSVLGFANYGLDQTRLV